ncbi:hypothetical protein R3P38DRAFT_3116707 [Favolaschia claudopus]|uniref:F-box domain-containing protein n=1 Tax=Favolaschia claudopus TaxID=2862362 RepID=A0AAV9ZF20_9AGAR
MSSRTPLDIPELLGNCLISLADHPGTLLACSLVARSWVDTTQSLLFRAPHRTAHTFSYSDDAVLCFCDALNCSYRLIRHVRELSIIESEIQVSTLQMLCSIPFTRLEILSVAANDPPQLAGICRPLLALPSLQTLNLTTGSRFAPCLHFLTLCPSIQHLRLLYDGPDDEPPTLPLQAHPIRLKSLSLNFLHHTDYVRPQSLHPTAFPLVDLSNLKALEIVEEKYIDWQTLSLATRQSIKFYDVHLWDSPGINLSLFPNLSVLRIVGTGETWSPIISTLRTLSDTEPPRQSIQTLVLNVQSMDMQFERDNCAPLDRLLCSATLSRAGIQFEMDSEWNNNALEESLRKAFLAVVAQKRFQIVSRSWAMRQSWRKDVIDSL